MRLLFIGDIVGSVGRKALKTCLPKLRAKYNPTWIVVNGENAAAGRGITAAITREFFEQGVQGITMGNHTWDQKDIFEFIDDEPRLVRPANFPAGTPGAGMTFIGSKDKELAVINLQGRTFLPPLDCPFAKADELVSMARKRTPYIFVDFHAEATSEKLAMGWHLDGRVSAVVGTHTHVQTHDERILPQGTAYLTDVGMVGPRDGILGMEREAVMYKFKTSLPARFVVDEGTWHFHAVCIDVNPETGLGQKLQLVRMTEDDLLFE
ncbi:MULTISPECIES: TIGR00282 family metallophosphoesterase [unclassified Paenibacillus]|uniref:TIGR00282 family metallophosphoesterase n=1 Tax=unclassified Paenibacillus TaxID=185978 RepID=UPI000931E9CC|nr:MULTISPECIES: TIGR00282 family metallophosphoesterase [unclassified Paenibacillus]